MTDKNKSFIKSYRGWLRLSASAPGYHPAERRVEVQGDTEVTIRLYPRRPVQEAGERRSPYEGKPWTPPVVWHHQPALIIGLGGTGRSILSHVKKGLLEAGAGRIPDDIRLALLDTPEDTRRQDDVATPSLRARLSPAEIVEMGDDLQFLVQHLRSHPEDDPILSGWFPAEEYGRRLSPDELNLAHGTRQRRPLARAMLVNDLRKGIPQEGVDVLLIIDRSGSMGDPLDVQSSSSPARLKVVQDAASTFLSQMDVATDRIGVIVFNENAQLLSPFSRDYVSAREKIYALSPGGNTSIYKALILANELIEKEPRGERSKAVILLTDGEDPDASLAYPPAEQLKARGVHLVTVGIGGANETALQKIASTWNAVPDYHFAKDATGLQGIYVRLARRMGEGSRIWRLLHGAAAATINGDSLRVVIAASLIGGFGSAILSDIAYLLRKAGQALGVRSISIEGYLVTHDAFSHILPSRTTAQVNNFAAIREIERFQLAQGFPFRMAYDHRFAAHDVLFGEIQWRLFDELYLFDRIPDIPPGNNLQKERWNNPAWSTFPAIADAIIFSLDKAGEEKEYREYRRAIQGASSREQWAQEHAVAGSLGIYQYHVPVRYVFDILKIRYAIAIVTQLLTGNAHAEATKLLASQNREDPESGLAHHVTLFLLGYAGYEDPACPPILPQIAGAITEGREVTNLQAPVLDIEAEASSYAAYLRGAVIVLLNGLKTSPLHVARTGKVGYVLQFLDTLAEFLHDTLYAFGDESKYHSLIERYIEITRQTRERLQKVVHLLLVGQQSEAPDNLQAQEDFIPGLLTQLRLRLEEVERVLEEQRAILTRKILLEDADITRWYEEYFASPQGMEEAISRFYWVLGEDNTLSLELRTWEITHLRWGDSPRQTRRIQAAFMENLLRLTGYIGRAMLEEQTITTWLETHGSQAVASQMAEDAWRNSRPLLSVVEQLASQAQAALVVGMRQGAPTIASMFTSLLRTSVTSERQFIPRSSTHPYTFPIVRTLDVVPLNALKTLNTAKRTYMQWYGLLSGSKTEGRAEPSAVFHAEKVALSLEELLPAELRQAARLLSPVLVTALETDDIARLYAVMFASGFVTHRPDKNLLMLTPPGISSLEIQLPATDDFAGRIHPYVLGMMLFLQRYTLFSVGDMQKALDTVNLDVWRPWTTRQWQNHPLARQLLATGSATDGDFAAFVALTTRKAFLKRLNA